MTSSPEARRAANGEAQKGHRSPIGSPSLLYRRVLHVRHLRCRIGSFLLVVRSRSDRVAPFARTDRVRLGPDIARRPHAQASLGIDRRGNPLRPAIARRLAAPTRRPFVFCSRYRVHAFHPLLKPRARERARTLVRSTGLGRGHRAGGLLPAEQRTGPAVKTSSPRLAPRDAKRAVGGIRAWAGNPGRRASQPRLYSHSQRLRTLTANGLLRLLPVVDEPTLRARPVGTRPLPPARAAAPCAPQSTSTDAAEHDQWLLSRRNVGTA